MCSKIYLFIYFIFFYFIYLFIYLFIIFFLFFVFCVCVFLLFFCFFFFFVLFVCFFFCFCFFVCFFFFFFFFFFFCFFFYFVCFFRTFVALPEHLLALNIYHQNIYWGYWLEAPRWHVYYEENKCRTLSRNYHPIVLLHTLLHTDCGLRSLPYELRQGSCELWSCASTMSRWLILECGYRWFRRQLYGFWSVWLHDTWHRLVELGLWR